MKLLPQLLLASALLLSGCAGSEQRTDSTVHWWNPASYSWSSVLPWHWFGNSLQVTDQGLGPLNSMSAINEQSLSQALGSNYRLRQGMGTGDGQIKTYIQALRDDKLAITFYGASTISRIEIRDAKITTDRGMKIGSLFSQSFKQAYGHCQLGANPNTVLCLDTQSQHIDYLYQGDSTAPAGLMPADQTLQNWTLTAIIWHA